MSRTYEILCHDCKVRLWIGQGRPETRQYIYKAEPEFTRFEQFLFAHQNHRLEFGDDEPFSLLDGYTRIDGED